MVEWTKMVGPTGLKAEHPPPYERIGRVLIAVQSVESFVKRAVAIVLPGLEVPTAKSDKEMKLPLGPLLEKLRERVDVDPSFDDKLRSFLWARNVFVHDLTSIPVMAMFNGQDQQVALNEFLSMMERACEELQNGFAPIVLRWIERVPPPPGIDVEPFLRHLRSVAAAHPIAWYSEKR